jgi:mannose-1-phosphate guanylyltransferase
VLAGGDGTRLQTLTRALTGAPIPKQYCRLLGDRSLLETTLERIAPLVPARRTLVVMNRDHLGVGGDQVRALPPRNVLVQPANRDTGPGVLFALLELARRAPHATVAVFPSDHYVRDGGTFLAQVGRAVRVITQMPDRIAVLAVRPERIEPELGYIEPGIPIRLGDGDGALEVAAFHEKPSREDAAHIVRRGGLWNSFVMVFRAERALQIVRQTRPADYAHQQGLAACPERLPGAYRSLPSWNFSRDVLARVPHHLVAVPTGDVGWSDWGTPEAVLRTLSTLADPPSWVKTVRVVAA